MLRSEIHEGSGVVVVDIIAEQIGQLDTCIEGHLAAGRRRFVLDLHAAGFLNSTSIAAIVQAHKRVAKAGGRMQLAAVPDPVRSVLRILRLDRIFSLERDVASAINDLKSAG